MCRVETTLAYRRERQRYFTLICYTIVVCSLLGFEHNLPGLIDNLNPRFVLVSLFANMVRFGIAPKYAERCG